ncbi:MAG TPA: zf-HC2 domain-containing protein [Candidatus Limnocylindrales bacterium]
MSFGRRRRPDDWSTVHARAQSDLSDRLDGSIEPLEAAWVEDHLAECAECRSVAHAYETQRQELRAMRDPAPLPPRDLWARTAAAIEQEPRFRDRRRSRPRRSFAPLLAAALVVAVVVGTLTSSRLLFDDGHAAHPSGGGAVAAGSQPAGSAFAFATPIPVNGHVQWISQSQDGSYTLRDANVQEVCPDKSSGCDATAPVENQPVTFATEPQTVFGSSDGTRLIVVNRSAPSDPGSVAVVTLQPEPSAPASQAPTSTPAASATVAASGSPTPSGTPATSPSTPPASAPPASAPPASQPPGSQPPASATPEPSDTSASQPPSATPDSSATPAPSVTITPSPQPGGAVEIAKNVVLVGQSAAYSPSGDWFAFTARPADGSVGPDIYLWKVGEPAARAITTDHGSVFGSWTRDNQLVGSSVVEAPSPDQGSAAPERVGASFVIDPGTAERTALPETGRTWRPSVDPTGRRAVYWTGTLKRAADAPVDLPDAGQLVIGDWVRDLPSSSDAPRDTPAPGDQATARHETTIDGAAVTDWDARWDSTGTRLAVWIADPRNPQVGSLSLYNVDPFNGRVDLKKPLLDGQRATAGFSLSDSKLVWAEPSADGSGDGGRILVLAWTDHGVGTVETLPDKVFVIR